MHVVLKSSKPCFQKVSQLVARIHDIRGLAFILAWIYDLGIMEALYLARSSRDSQQGNQRIASVPSCIKLFMSVFGWEREAAHGKGCSWSGPHLSQDLSSSWGSMVNLVILLALSKPHFYFCNMEPNIVNKVLQQNGTLGQKRSLRKAQRNLNDMWS